MLDEPDFIGGIGCARFREGAHGVEAAGVGLEAAPADVDRLRQRAACRAHLLGFSDGGSYYRRGGHDLVSLPKSRRPRRVAFWPALGRVLPTANVGQHASQISRWQNPFITPVRMNSNRPPSRPEPPGKFLEPACQPPNRTLIRPRRQRKYDMRSTPLFRAEPKPLTRAQFQRIARNQPIIFRVVATRRPDGCTLYHQLDAAANSHRHGFAIANFKRDACGYFSHDSLRQKSS